MNVKSVTLFLPSLRGGGAERVMVNLARGFAEKGFKVDMVLARAEGPYLSEVPKEVRIVDLKAKRVLYGLPGLVGYLRRERPKAMLSSLNHANIVALVARKISRVSFRLVIREATTVRMSTKDATTLRGKLMPSMMRLFYPWADGVIAISKGVGEDLIKTIGVPEEKVKVIYNPAVTPEIFIKADEPLVHPWFAPGEPPVILGVGRLTGAKDFSTLIRSFALVKRERPARLMILGEGEKRAELEGLVQQMGLEADVELPGFVDNPYNYMKQSKVFVLSSQWEGLPNVLIQALAIGTPVVSTDCPSGPAEILEEGKWGHLVSLGDQMALAKNILASLEEEMSISTSSEVGEYAKSRFGLDCAISAYSDILLGDE